MFNTDNGGAQQIMLANYKKGAKMLNFSYIYQNILDTLITSHTVLTFAKISILIMNDILTYI